MATVSRIVRVLVVEDFEPFRQFVCSTTRDAIPACRSSAKRQTGLEAVRTADELRPDLILLDIGLPSLNGLAAARADSQGLPKIQDHLRYPGVFSRSLCRRLSARVPVVTL